MAVSDQTRSGDLAETFKSERETTKNQIRVALPGITGAAGQPTVSATNVHNTGFDITVSPGSGYGSSADAYYIAMGY